LAVDSQWRDFKTVYDIFAIICIIWS